MQKSDAVFFTVLMIAGSLAFHILSRYVRNEVDPLFAAVLANGAAFGLCLLCYFIFPRSYEPAPPQGAHMAYCLMAGAAIGVANLAVFGMYKAGMQVSIAVPLTRTAVAVGAVVLGILLFSEQISIMNILGICLSVIALIFMAL